MNKREQQRQIRRCQILECSLDMIVSHGYEAMKIRDIAKKLHISTGLFFNYFESKEKIYEELVRIGLTGPENALKLNEEGADPIELFEKMTGFIFDAVKSRPFVAKMFVLMARTCHYESVPESVKKLIAGMDAITPLVPVIMKGQQLGEIKQGEPYFLLAAYWGAVQGVAEMASMKPDLPMPESSCIVDMLRA